MGSKSSVLNYPVAVTEVTTLFCCSAMATSGEKEALQLTNKEKV